MNYVASIMALFTTTNTLYILISFLGDYPGQIDEKMSARMPVQVNIN